jgi:protein involved in polysaccharide export with SLBB domain
MISRVVSITIALMISCNLATLAQAQSVEQLLRLQSNPSLARQLQDQLGTKGKERGTPEVGVPTSGETQVLNTDDALVDPGLLTQSAAPQTSEESVTQRYYRILAGEILPIYGAREFAQSQDPELLFFNTMGKDYRLAAGDVLRVTLRGLTESDASYKIGRDGNLILPALAPFSVAGLTIAEAEIKLLDVLRYDDASAAVFMSLETARLITVQVSGAVKNPRTIAVPAYTPLSRVLAYAGGIKPTGSLRNIVLRDRDGGVSEVDFYDFLQSPEGANDPLVTDSSRVFVGNQGNTIAAIGFVARPGIYELPESLAKLAVEEILDLSGTRIIPPGVELEALYFDGSGLAQSRAVARGEYINAGEVLSIRFLPTRLTDAIRVKGAVLEDYQIATAQPIAIRDVLKSGATLTEEASRDLALIIGEDAVSQVIDLERAFADPSVTLSPGEALYVFTPRNLRAIAQADLNESDNVVLRGFIEAAAGELFLNGERISFIPLGSVETFGDVIRPFYRLTPQTSLEIAILENDAGEARAVSLRSLLQSLSTFTLSDGDKIHLFDNDFLQIRAEEIGSFSQSSNFEGGTLQLAQNGNSNWRQLSQLFTRAGVVRVLIDGKVRAFLPGSDTNTLRIALDTLGIDNLDRFSDLVVIAKNSSTDRKLTEIKSLVSDKTQPLNGDLASVEFLTIGGKKELLSDSTGADFEKLQSLALSLYVDYELEQFGVASDIAQEESNLGRKVASPDVYPLFAIYEYFDPGEGFWQRVAVSASDLKSPSFASQIQPGARVTLFTREFLSDLLTSGSGSGSGSDATQQLIGLQALGTELNSSDVNKEDQQALLNGLLANAERAVSTESETDVLTPNLQFILSASRYVAGAVERPGYYPVAGSVTLSQLLAATGGITENADISNIEVIKQKATDGKIVADKIMRVDLTKSDANDVRLSDRYSINIPNLINEAATGLVTLKGEVQRPGDYLFARNETLHDVIERAGGLSEVAYPLGAVFTRESLRESQRESNALLADQLEQAVLQVAQSDMEGVGEQVKAVLGYAQQLRLQKVTGRLSVNVLTSEVSAPVYLQAGDELTIPKRPAHVSVIGSVQKDTVASYSSGKRLGAYLSAAGGANRIADLKRTYILLPNGESTSADEDSIIPPGAVIIVPPKTDRLSVLGLTDLVSRVLGNIATSVLAINNVQ